MQQWDGEKIIDIRLFHLIIEHLVIAEYDIFVMPILTKFILQHRRGKGTNQSWANTNNMPRRSEGFQENNKWASCPLLSIGSLPVNTKYYLLVPFL
jgi:hypothetical protein